MALLDINTTFAGHTPTRLLSTHHEGEREVYLAVDDATGQEVVLTLFNPKSPKYSPNLFEDNPKPLSLNEIFLLSQRDAGKNGFIQSDMNGADRNAAGDLLLWMRQPFFGDCRLSDWIEANDTLSVEDAVTVCRAIMETVSNLASITRGGGHFNISPDNVLISFKDGAVEDVRLIGLSSFGSPSNGDADFRSDERDPRFRAPETLMGITNNLCDIYSVGMLLAVMLVGVPEYPSAPSTEEGEKPSLAPLSQVTRHKEFLKAFTESFNHSSVSGPLKMIVTRAINPAPMKRFQKVEAFSNILEKVCKATPLPGRKEEQQKSKNAPKPKPQTKEKKEEPAPVKGPQGLDAVAGMDDLKHLFRRNFIRILKYPEIAKAYGISPCNCTLLYGPQGCGKSFIAEKVAQESGLKYKIVNPSDLGSIYVHGSQEKIAETFREAEKNSPMILIFDEFDAIAPKRDAENHHHQAGEVNELLTRLNNCAERGVYVLAATNRPEMVDPAILRTGRVDQMFFVPLPDFKARHDLFALELEKRPCNPEIDLNALASATENYTCSDLTHIVAECARKCFDDTLSAGLDTPVPLDQQRLMEVISNTRPSVSAAQMKSYLDMKERIESQSGKNALPKVGFLHDS